MLICQCNVMHRRDVICGGGAAMFGALITALMSGSKPVKAEALSGSVPELDSVAVRVVVDSYQFAVAPSRKLADVDIQHFGWGVSGDKPPGKTRLVSSACRCTLKRGAVQKHAMSSWTSASRQRR